MAERHQGCEERSCHGPPLALQQIDRANQKFAYEAERRPHSGQEARDGIRPDPSYELDPRPDYRLLNPYRSTDLNLFTASRPLRVEVLRTTHGSFGPG